MKMTNGEEVLATVIEHAEHTVTVTHPMCIMPNPDQPGALMIFPWSVATVDRNKTVEVAVNRSAMVFIVEDVPVNIEKFYVEQTSGIIMDSSELSNTKLIL
jgi:hypothetical protein